MAVIKFGHTWWGKKWLNSLSHIDYSNRLPRGERYARNGSVKNISIEGTSITASVQGRLPQPYRVSMNLAPFTGKEIEKISSLISGSSYYLAQLESRTLPPELYEDLEKEDIILFPGSWKELNMKCSCPDWAVPCKHLASVVYIIANEIDKNPFIVFSLKGMDLLETFALAGKTEGPDITSISSLVLEKPEEYNYYREKLEDINFYRIPGMESTIGHLLTEFPLFYLKNDFKVLILEHYRRMSRNIKKYIRGLDIKEDKPDILYTSGLFKIFKNKMAFSGSLKRGKESLIFNSEECKPLIEYIQILSAGDLSLYPPLISFLIMIHNFVLMIIEKSAFIPEILSLKENTFIIRWIPALFTSEIKQIFSSLEEALPKELVKYGTSSLDNRNQVLFLISIFTSYYHDLFTPVKDAGKDPILSIFFRRNAYISRLFEEKENARTINLWLGRFFIRPALCYPVIHIDEAGSGEFNFDIRVGNRGQDKDIRPIPFSDFLEQNSEEKFPLLRDLSLLSTYLHAVSTFLKKNGPVKIPGDKFLENWFKALPVLKTLGVRTVLPRSLEDAFYPELTLTFKPKKTMPVDKVVSYTSLNEMLTFEWAVALGDDFVSAKEFKKLMTEGRGIVRYKDSYIQITEEKLDKLIRHLEKGGPELSSLDILKINLEATYNGTPIETDTRLKEIFASLFKQEKVSLPAGLNGTLRPYQLAGYRWLYHNCRIGLGSLIADDMGLGKTVQIITLFLKFLEEGDLTKQKKALVIVPASLVDNWLREIEKFAPKLQAAAFHGAGRSFDEEVNIIITTYGLIRRDTEAFQKKKWLCIVIDEAQNIKNPIVAQTKSVKALKADFKVAMTGTPVENKLLDYWSILDFIMKNLLGNKTFFKDKFAIPIERFRDTDTLSAFKKLTGPFIMRRIKTDKTIIDDLPEKIVINRIVSLSQEQIVLYQGLVDRIDELLESLEGIERSGVIFKLISGIKQICNHPTLYLKEGPGNAKQSGKSVMLLDLLEKINIKNEKALIFSQFTQMGRLLIPIIKEAFGTEPLFFHGGLSRKKRDSVIKEFQEGDVPFMIFSLKAGGVGLNLTAANHVIHYDLWWNPAVENQATDRVFRIGQTRNVNVYRFITRGTFEEKINSIIEDKQELSELTVARGEKWISDMSTGELKDLLKLERV